MSQLPFSASALLIALIVSQPVKDEEAKVPTPSS